MLDKLERPAKIQRSVAGIRLWAGRAGLCIAVGVAYFLAARLGLVFLTSAERVAVFWPASGVAVGVLIAIGPWARAPVALTVMAASVAAALSSDRSLWSAVAFAVCNVAEALIAVWLIERWFGPAFDLDRLRRVLGFFAATAIATAMAAAGASSAMQLLGPSTAAFLDVWRVWFVSDALGILTVAPLLIGVSATVRDPPSWRELVEGGVAVAAVTVATGFLLTVLAGPWSLVGPSVVVFPFLLWLSYRSRPVFAAAAVFTVAGAIVWTTTYEFGRYGDPTEPLAIRVVAAQTAMLGITWAALCLAALFAERRRSEAALGESDTRLRSILDAANVIAWDIDLTRNTVHSAGPVTRLLRRSASSLPRDLAAMVYAVHPDDRDSVMAQFWAAVSTGTAFRLEFRLNTDSLCWVMAEGSIERDAHGQAVRVRGVTHDITERKRTELALAEREVQLGLAGKAALVGNFAVDYATGRVQTSPGYAAIHGLAEGTEELTREEWRARLHPDDLRRLDALRTQVFAERRGELNIEYRIVGADGSARWIESRGLVSYDGDGRATRLVGVHIDITERKRAEGRLLESERKLRELLGALPAAIYVTDAKGHITYCNQGAIDLWGVEPALGTDRWSDMGRFYHADGSPMVLADCPTEIALKQGRIVRGREAIIERRDGIRVPIAPYPTPLRDETGAIVGVVNMTVDISERKRAERALAERNLQLALAGKAALVGSYAYDVASDVMQVEEGYAALHGLPDGTRSTTRSEWKARVHQEDLGRLEAARSQAFSNGRSEYGFEYRIVRSTGEVRWIESRSFVSYDSDACPQRVVGVSIDITERKLAEEHLRMMVAELDHRVKNALATVSALTSRTQAATGSVADFVAALDGRIQSMAATHQLLSSQQWKGILLADLARRELAPYATGDNTEIGGPDIALKAEAAQAVSMVFHELATNAAKHGALSTPSGRVAVRWYRSQNRDGDARLCLEWEETGGPPVQAPSRCGYGMQVIRDLLPYELDGEVDLAFPAEGVRCRFDIPLSQATGGDRTAAGPAAKLASHGVV